MAIVKKLSESRDKTCAVRFSESEFKEVQRACELSGTSISSVLRSGARLMIEKIQLELLEKEAKRNEIKIMSNITYLVKTPEENLLVKS